MKNKIHLCILLTLTMIVCLFQGIVGNGNAARAAQESGRKMILVYTSNLRGNISRLSQIAIIKKEFEKQENTTVKLVDTGNYLQGTKYTSYDLGTSYIRLMKSAGYDAIGIGRYDVQFGDGTVGNDIHKNKMSYGSLGEHAADSGVAMISSNLVCGFAEGQNPYIEGYTSSVTFSDGDFKAGIFAISSEEVADCSVLNKVSVKNPQETAQEKIQELRQDNSVVIGLDNSGKNFPDDLGAVICRGLADGTFSIGAVSIDEDTNEVTPLEVPSLEAQQRDETVEALADQVRTEVDEMYPSPEQVAVSNVTLNGNQKDVRSKETNLGNFWCDALRWYATSGKMAQHFSEEDVQSGNTSIAVDGDHTVAVWNGGNLRNYINTGEVVYADLFRVLWFPNTVSVAYLTGEQLLELLEASAQNITSENSEDPGFLSVSGIQYTIDAGKDYDQGEESSVAGYYKANSIKKVSVQNINGKPLDMEAYYAVITSRQYAMGTMNSGYIMKDKSEDETYNSTDTDVSVRDAVLAYIQDESGLNHIIGGKYAGAEGRIHIQFTGEDGDAENPSTPTDTPAPTNTPQLTGTATPAPTNTPRPTGTATPAPTNTPAPAVSGDKNGAGTGTANLTNGNSSKKEIIPAKVIIKSAASKARRKITIKWKKTAGAKGYVIYEVRKSGKKTKYKKLVIIKKGSTTSYTFKKMRPGKKYKLALRAFAKDGKKTVYSKKYSKTVTVRCKE